MRPYTPHLLIGSGDRAAQAVTTFVEDLRRDGQGDLARHVQRATDAPEDPLRALERLRSSELWLELEREGLAEPGFRLSRLLVVHIWELPVSKGGKPTLPSPLLALEELRRQLPEVNLIEVVLAANPSDRELRPALELLRAQRGLRTRRYLVTRHSSRNLTYDDATLYRVLSRFLRMVLFGQQLERSGVGALTHPGSLVDASDGGDHIPVSLLGLQEILLPTRQDIQAALAASAMGVVRQRDDEALPHRKEYFEKKANAWLNSVASRLTELANPAQTVESAQETADKLQAFLREGLQTLLRQGLRPEDSNLRVRLGDVATVLDASAARVRAEFCTAMPATLPSRRTRLSAPPPPERGLLGRVREFVRPSAPPPPLTSHPPEENPVLITLNAFARQLGRLQRARQEMKAALGPSARTGEAFRIQPAQSCIAQLSLRSIPHGAATARALEETADRVENQLIKNLVYADEVLVGLSDVANDSAAGFLGERDLLAALVEALPDLAAALCKQLEVAALTASAREGLGGSPALFLYGDSADPACTTWLRPAADALRCGLNHTFIRIPSDHPVLGAVLISDNVDPGHLMPYFSS